MELLGSHKRRNVKQIRQKGSDVFAKVYDENVNDIYRFIFFKVSNKEEAHDLTSTVFLKTWTYIQDDNSIDKDKSVRALLYKVARNLIIDHYRYNSNRKSVSLENADYKLQISDEGQDLDKKMEKKSDLDLIKSKLPLLKDEYREIIVLRYINDFSLNEIADILGKKKGNVRVILHRAMESLKKIIEEKEV